MKNNSAIDTMINNWIHLIVYYLRVMKWIMTRFFSCLVLRKKSNQMDVRSAATVKEYQDRLKRTWKQEHQFDRTGHNGSPLDKCYIQNMILCCEEILQGAQGIKDCSSPTDHQEDTHDPYE